MTSRSDIRAALTRFDGQTRVPVTYNGVTVEILRPSVERRAAILQKALDKAKQIGDNDLSTSLDADISLCIELVVVPGTTEKVFEEADREAFKSSPSGSFYDVVTKKLNSVLGLADQEALEKK